MTKIRVALIEDHDLTRLGIRTALGHNVDFELVGEAANANDGLQILKTLQPDVAIVDIGLPDKNGIELIKEVKLQNPKLLTKILVLTLRDSKEAVLAAFAAGADSYCIKNTYDNLLEAVRHTHNGNAWIDPAIARIVLQETQENPPTITTESKTNQFQFASKPEFINSIEENKEIVDPYNLTEKELEVLQLIVNGCSNAVIAERLYITVGTVKTHVRNILNKLAQE
ncbi:MAG: response regulator transcription factor [Cyanobacteria bacterium P01_D01_bin.116]